VTVTITLTEVRSVTGANLYRVKQDTSAATHISNSVFVYNTEDESYGHVATVFDIENISCLSKSAAETAGDDNYRLSTVTKDWETLDLALEFSSYNKSRIQELIEDYATYADTFAGTTVTVYTSA